ncbi:hypothetical protein [Gorillibacterium timonense]|uniref:hypothetical protein n=1 Tax=Gorillibacterium timonense TaxID=1689269 RepID=UPI00071C7BF2|nr:hypothetical protein [Gorillibacterium timonense]
MLIPIVLTVILVGFAVGWVRLFEIKLRADRVIAFGILLILAGNGFGGGKNSVGVTFLLLGLAIGLLGFFFGTPRDKS